MRHSHTSRISAKALLAVVGFGLLSACSDVSAPTAEITAKAPAGFNKLVGVTTFVYSPSKGVTKSFGNHMIVIPAGAVCQLGTSGYGKDYWDQPCTAETKSIMITANSFVDANGTPYVDFQPAMRFSPSKTVTLYMRDGNRQSTQTINIVYCSTPVTCMNESLTDASLATHRIGNSRILYRRLKHFSGYAVAYSGDCTDGTVETLDDGSLYCNTDGGRGASRSGYVVASGLGKTSTGDTFGRRRRADK